MKVMGVYKITCLANGKIYIGSTINFDKRRKEHWRLLKGNYHRNKYLQYAWNKHGEQQFTIEILEEVTDQELLIPREQYWIDITNCCVRKIGFNITPTAGGTYGYRYTLEQKANCGKWVRNKEFREKLRAFHLGTKATAETKEKMSKQRRGNGNGMFGKNHSEESKLKMSETRIKVGATRGIKHNKAKLTDEDIRTIRKLFRDGLTSTEIAKRYGLAKSTTGRINRGIIWAHVEG